MGRLWIHSWGIKDWDEVSCLPNAIYLLRRSTISFNCSSYGLGEVMAAAGDHLA